VNQTIKNLQNLFAKYWKVLKIQMKILYQFTDQ